MPDLDLSPSASFISSKEGGTPSICSRSLMSSKSSCCLRVSIGAPHANRRTKKQLTCVLCWFPNPVKRFRSVAAEAGIQPLEKKALTQQCADRRGKIGLSQQAFAHQIAAGAGRLHAAKVGVGAQ